MNARILHGSIASLAALISVTAATADIYINSDHAEIDGFTGTAAGVRYRLSNSNWDMSLDNGKGTSKSSDYISANLGNNKQLSSNTYAFTLTNLAGQGLIWQLTDVESGKTTTEAWGSFDSKPDGTVKSTLNGIAPGASFNTLLLEARASSSGSSMEFGKLVFDSDLVVKDGSFEDGLVTPSTAGPDDSKGYWSQQVVSTTNLAAVNWALSGFFHGQRTGSGGDEEVKFSINLRDAIVSVPAPGAIALLGVVGLLNLAGSRRRDRGRAGA